MYWSVYREFALVQKVHASKVTLIEMSEPPGSKTDNVVMLTSLYWTFLDMSMNSPPPPSAGITTICELNNFIGLEEMSMCIMNI